MRCGVFRGVCRACGLVVVGGGGRGKVGEVVGGVGDDTVGKRGGGCCYMIVDE